MSWLRLDDDMLDHPKWVRAIRDGGSEALHLWVALCSWCSRHLTDGVIPADIVPTIASVLRSRDRTRAIRALEASQLVATAAPGDVHIVDYLERNPSRAETLEKRDRKAKSQRDYADRRKLTGQQPVVVIDDREVTGAAPSRSRPDPVPSREDLGSARKPRAPKPRTHCPHEFEPNAAALALALKLGVDLEVELPQFVDHHLAKATLGADWQAALRTWIRNAPKFSPAPRKAQGGARQWMVDELERARREEAANEAQ